MSSRSRRKSNRRIALFRQAGPQQAERGLRIVHGAEDFDGLDRELGVGLLDDGHKRAAGQRAHLDQRRPHVGMFGGAGRIGQHRDQRPDGRAARVAQADHRLEPLFRRRVLQLPDQPGDSLGVLQPGVEGRHDGVGQSLALGPQGGAAGEIEEHRRAKLLAQVGQLLLVELGVEHLLQEALGQVRPAEVGQDLRRAGTFGGRGRLGGQDRRHGRVFGGRFLGGRLLGGRRVGLRLGFRLLGPGRRTGSSTPLQPTKRLRGSENSCDPLFSATKSSTTAQEAQKSTTLTVSPAAGDVNGEPPRRGARLPAA